MFRIRIALLVTLVLCVFSGPSYSAAGEFLSVQVKQAQVRSSPSFLGNVSGTVAYGEKVEIIEDKGAWKMVATPKIKGKGWMHASALTTKTIALQAGKADVKTGATSSELALAGKGFNPKVEAEFKSKNQQLDYTAIDRMEKTFTFKPGQVQAFLKQGQVQPPGGAVR
jgi:SH3-like domain-containing protein